MTQSMPVKLAVEGQLVKEAPAPLDTAERKGGMALNAGSFSCAALTEQEIQPALATGTHVKVHALEHDQSSIDGGVISDQVSFSDEEAEMSSPGTEAKAHMPVPQQASSSLDQEAEPQVDMIKVERALQWLRQPVPEASEQDKRELEAIRAANKRAKQLSQSDARRRELTIRLRLAKQRARARATQQHKKAARNKADKEIVQHELMKSKEHVIELTAQLAATQQLLSQRDVELEATLEASKKVVRELGQQQGKELADACALAAERSAELKQQAAESAHKHLVEMQAAEQKLQKVQSQLQTALVLVDVNEKMADSHKRDYCKYWADLQELRGQHQECEEHLAAERGASAALRTERDGLQQQCNHMHVVVMDLTKERDSAKEAYESLRTAADRLSQDKKRYKERVTSLKQKLGEELNIVMSLRAQVQHLSQQKESEQEELEGLRQQAVEFEPKLQELWDEHTTLLHNYGQLRDLFNGAVAHRDQLLVELTQLKADRTAEHAEVLQEEGDVDFSFWTELPGSKSQLAPLKHDKDTPRKVLGDIQNKPRA